MREVIGAIREGLPEADQIAARCSISACVPWTKAWLPLAVINLLCRGSAKMVVNHPTDRRFYWRLACA